ncbi:MAG: methyltransferase domain-containing protein [Chromatiaceae bacterium]|nr:methyltransferase domain-containing protein [Chromatiaceae bacterium]
MSNTNLTLAVRPVSASDIRISASQMACRLCDSSLFNGTLQYSLAAAPNSAQELPSQKEFSAHGECPGLDLHCCAGCGHYQLVSEPVSYWKEVVTAAGLSQQMRDFRTNQLNNWVSQHELSDKSIIEVGCGAGYLLEILSVAGVQATGLEYGAAQIKAALAAGRVVRQGYILDSGLYFDRQFDGFICINVLEHAPEPVRFLRAIRTICKPGAVGIVEVPNFQKDIKLHKSHNLIRDHLSYFTTRTLALALHLAGFELLSLRECWYGDDLEAQVRVPADSPLTSWSEGTPTTKVLTQLFRAEPGRVAIWGASHQALTLIAMTRPTNVYCIADSAPFKQGKVDPVCGIPIISPEEMIADCPDLVIIIAAGYSQEVNRIIKADPSFHGRVVVLDDLVMQGETEKL